VAPADEHAIRDAARRLAAGEIVAIPTETVYGLAASAFDERAIVEVFRAKGRPSFDPLIVHLIADRDPLAALHELGIVDSERLAAKARLHAERLAKAFWPGALTLVLPKGPAISDLVTSGLDTVAVRAPSHPVARAVLSALGGPVVAPSANRFGHVSPTCAEHVRADLGGRVELVLDGGPCTVGVESTIVGVEDDGTLRLLRPGGVSVEDLGEVVGVALAGPRQSETPQAPGMLSSHYAPRRPLWLLHGEASVSKRSRRREGCRVALLTFAPWTEARVREAERTWAVTVVRRRHLSAAGDVAEAARSLFAAMRELDTEDVEAIVAEPSPATTGLGRAIADRLARAAAERGSLP
jgi:L-threonylcarbamoyladenylate synthase